MERLGNLEHIVHKSAKDVVTEADHLSEEVILATVRARLPGRPVPGGGIGPLRREEGHRPERRRRRGRGRSTRRHRIWIVDPLDGTVNYANALPFFCASVALVVGGRPTVGVVLDPVRDELYSAVAGRRRLAQRRAGRATRARSGSSTRCPTWRCPRTGWAPPGGEAAQGDPGRAASSAARRWPWRTSRTRASTPSSRRAACRSGTSRRPG